MIPSSLSAVRSISHASFKLFYKVCQLLILTCTNWPAYKLILFVLGILARFTEVNAYTIKRPKFSHGLQVSRTSRTICRQPKLLLTDSSVKLITSLLLHEKRTLRLVVVNGLSSTSRLSYKTAAMSHVWKCCRYSIQNHRIELMGKRDRRGKSRPAIVYMRVFHWSITNREGSHFRLSSLHRPQTFCQKHFLTLP